MSLFPAYANESNKKDAQQQETDQTDWLQNSSFKINLEKTAANLPSQLETTNLQSEELNTFVSNEPETSLYVKKRKKKHKHSDRKQKKRKIVLEDLSDIDESFAIDRKRNKEFLTVKTISRPAVPRYYIAYYMSHFRKRRKRKIKRYYNRIRKEDDDKSNSDESAVITKKNVNTIEGSKRDENFAGFKQEEELTHATAVYNKKLGENSRDIKLWLEYVNFQDTVFKFEKTYRKGSIAKGLRVMGERKLAILDKALNQNPNCEELLRERLHVAVSIYPADELQIQLKNLVEKDQGNIILWQGYIESTQCSMSHCNTPAVLGLYTKCLSILHKLRRSATMEKAQLEESILKMLYQCGLFFKQAGLFEQLWTLLRLYLELNLSPSDKNKFNISSRFEEKNLVELEEIVLNSQLPLHELWLRTEKLRESCHWLPFSADGECEDPQRLVFPEDVVELIHPITMPENIFKLNATIMSLLKIPLLPCRHSTMQELGLDYVPWALDSIESILPVFLPIHPIDLSNKNMIIDNRLSVGPQYLNVLPGQEEYLDFILITMKNCADCLTGDDRIAITVWWIRFQKILIILEKQERFKMPKNYTKKIKTSIKNLLKQEENRNNIIYYCEYALVELELGNKDSCLNILKTALNFAESKIVTNMISLNQTATCYLYRILIEVYLNDDCLENRNIILKYLSMYVLEMDKIVTEFTQEIQSQVELKYKHISWKLLQNDVEKLPAVTQFLPNFFTDWIICNGWFIYLTKGPIECGAFVEKILEQLDDKLAGSLWQKEVLFEFYVAVLFKHCAANPGYGIYKILDNVLSRAMENYPNNLFLLTVLAKEQSISSNFGCPWWKLKSILIKTGRAFPTLFLIIIANQQIVELQNNLIETFTGHKYGINDSFKNRMLALFRRITGPDMCTRRCGLVWRLYLQFVHSYFDPTLCRNIYYRAVEECPWFKALYIDAAIYIPAELGQIQDLLIEKQLRIHVTPEELDVLRS